MRSAITHTVSRAAWQNRHKIPLDIHVPIQLNCLRPGIHLCSELCCSASHLSHVCPASLPWGPVTHPNCLHLCLVSPDCLSVFIVLGWEVRHYILLKCIIWLGVVWIYWVHFFNPMIHCNKECALLPEGRISLTHFYLLLQGEWHLIQKDLHDNLNPNRQSFVCKSDHDTLPMVCNWPKLMIKISQNTFRCPQGNTFCWPKDNIFKVKPKP